MIKECNIVGAGPSKSSFEKNDLVTIQCNFLWTHDVDFCIALDPIVPLKMLDNPDLLPSHVKLIISKFAKQHITALNRYQELTPKLEAVFNITEGNMERKRSTGHYAAEYMISQGYNKLNLYGFDNWFGDKLCIDNWTHTKNTPHYVYVEIYHEPNTFTQKIPELMERSKFWNDQWQLLITKHSDVEFNFIP